MKAELRCERASMELSAYLDGELDDDLRASVERHVEACPRCRRELEAVSTARRALRARPTERVPDLSDRILERVAAEGPRARRHDEWAGRGRIAAVAAVAAAAVLAGVTLPWGQGPSEIAAAGEIARRVRAAARALDAYRAEYSIVERGWHPAVPVRRFRAEVAFEAPENLSMRIEDVSSYPSGAWPRNDVELVATARRWWIREPSLCPTAALPGCALEPSVERRGVVRRPPFDGNSSLPTDLIVPLETIASSEDFEVAPGGRLLGRRTYLVTLPHRQAVPLIASLQPGGSWRPFAPADEVRIWIDGATWFPLRFDVLTGPRQRPSLSVRAASFSHPSDLDPSTFEVPKAGVTIDGGFDPGPVRAGRATPRYIAGLSPYRAGTIGGGSTRVLSYVDGMTWLRASISPVDDVSPRAAAQEVSLSPGHFGYYEPAMESQVTETLKRRVDIYGRRLHVRLESNLSRAELIRVARSVELRGRKIEAYTSGGTTSVRVEPRRLDSVGFALRPRYLPEGYEVSSALLTEARDGRRTLTVYYRRSEAEFDGFGLRIVQSRPVELISPSAERFHAIQIGDRVGRFSEARNEVEWIDGRTYRAVAGPSFEARTLLRIARSLR